MLIIILCPLISHNALHHYKTAINPIAPITIATPLSFFMAPPVATTRVLVAPVVEKLLVDDAFVVEDGEALLDTLVLDVADSEDGTIMFDEEVDSLDDVLNGTYVPEVVIAELVLKDKGTVGDLAGEDTATALVEPPAGMVNP